MLLALSSDQELFSETTAKLLDELVPVGELRRLRDDPVGFDPDYWRRGAELGWTSLLVGEAARRRLHRRARPRRPGPGGLRVRPSCRPRAAGRDQRGGRHPQRDRGQPATSVIGALVSGESMATWCLGEPPPNDRLGNIALEVRGGG